MLPTSTAVIVPVYNLGAKRENRPKSPNPLGALATANYGIPRTILCRILTYLAKIVGDF